MLESQAIGSVRVNVDIADAQFKLIGSGEAFAGKLAVESSSQIDPQLRWSDVGELIKTGSVTVDDVAIGNAADTLIGQNRRGFAGRITGSMTWSVGENGSARVESELTGRDISVDRVLLSRRIDLDFVAYENSIEIRALRGIYAGGQLQASGSWSLGNGNRVVQARIVRANGDRLLLPIHPSAKDWIGGEVTARATISGHGLSPWSEFRVRGFTSLHAGTTFHVPVGNAPLSVSSLRKVATALLEGGFSDHQVRHRGRRDRWPSSASLGKRWSIVQHGQQLATETTSILRICYIVMPEQARLVGGW